MGTEAVRFLWAPTQKGGEAMTYEHPLGGIHALYETAGLDVPVSESGVDHALALAAPQVRHGVRRPGVPVR
jgi:hypothetical protein